MFSILRPGDTLWDVPVVLYLVWTLVLFISSLIVLSCLNRETKKFNKRLNRSDNRLGTVEDLVRLENLITRYVKCQLGQGVLATLAHSFTDKNGNSNAESIRNEIETWFTERVKELQNINYSDKTIKRVMLSTIRSELTKHPLDIRGSRRSLEAAKIFLKMQSRAEAKVGDKLEFLDTTIIKEKEVEKERNKDRIVCPTVACDWVAAKTLGCFSMLVSLPTTIPLLFTFASFSVWLFDTITDMAVIENLWNFKLPILYPTGTDEEITYLSYQTLTIDLYAPLLLLILVFSLTFTLLSCSCSRLSDKYRLSADYSKPESEIPGPDQQDPTTVLSRYDFNISSAVTSSLPQFTLQFAAYIIIIYMLETLKYSKVDQATQDQIQEKLDEFSFTSLWFSGVGSAVALILAQYTAFKIQHEHCLTFPQRLLYLLACTFNTIAMMCSSLILVVVVFLPAATFIGRYHIMALLILGGVILGIGLCMSAVLAGFGLDPTKLETDKLHTILNSEGILTSFLRFTQSGSGRWRSILGGVTMIARLFSLLTINLFLPPSQLLVHPFLRFYSTSPRSPALHYAIAKQIVYYNLLTVLSSIMLSVDIEQFVFNHQISATTRNLLIYANVCGVPCLFISLFILFKFYSTYDLWTSNGVHLVYAWEDTMNGYDMMNTSNNETNYTVINNTTCQPITSQEELLITKDEEALENGSIDNSELTADPIAESTLMNGEDNPINGDCGGEDGSEVLSEQDECTEADRISVQKVATVRKQSKIMLQRQRARFNKKLNKSCFGECIVDLATVDHRGRWIDVSDLPN